MQDLTFFRGREAWVGEFLKMLPQDKSILRNYVWNASRTTHANAGHHVAMGLILLTQIAPRYGVWANDGHTFSNLYTLILGSTGSCKTASINIGFKVGRAAGITTLVDDVPGSREGFIDSLDDQTPGLNGRPRQALIYPEFADFLNITAAAGRGRQGGHASSLRGAIMNAYDGVAQERKLAGHREMGSSEVTQPARGTSHPVVSLLGGANYHVLSDATRQSDWLNGFFGRFLFIEGEMERYNFRLEPVPPTMEEVVNALRVRIQFEQARTIQSNPHFPPPCGEPPYTDLYPDAYDVLSKWAYRMHKGTQQEPNLLVAAAMPRLLPLCYRVALLLSYDHGEARLAQPGWRITLDEVHPAIFLVEQHLQAYRHAATHIVLNDEERPIRDVELALRHADAAGLTLSEGEISRHTSRNDRSVTDALRTLMSRGVVTKTVGPGGIGVRYRLVNGFAEKVLYMPNVERPSVDTVLAHPEAHPVAAVSGGTGVGLFG